MKSIAFVVFCFLCTLTQGAWAVAGGESEHTQCQGLGNPNSYCDGTEIVVDPPEVTPPDAFCVVPVTAANAFLAKDFFFSSVKKTCEKQCQLVSKTCTGVVKAQGKCFTAVNKGAKNFTLANCKELPTVSARKACSLATRSQNRANAKAVKVSVAQGTRVCTQSVAECVASCN